MTKNELEQAIELIMNRGNPAYTTPSGAFLEYLSELASKLDLSGFAEACAIYVDNCPEASNFIAARVPGILCNRYFTVLPNLNYDNFIQWSVRTTDWGRELKGSYTSPDLLKSAVELVRQAAQNHV